MKLTNEELEKVRKLAERGRCDQLFGSQVLRMLDEIEESRQIIEHERGASTDD